MLTKPSLMTSALASLAILREHSFEALLWSASAELRLVVKGFISPHLSGSRSQLQIEFPHFLQSSHQLGHSDPSMSTSPLCLTTLREIYASKGI